ncbi:MAG: ABC transporter permease subunit [Candidatus Nitronauta litoralis]|uniref:ABC transporter permease subunit n=1 Tax=Candidatus Nitronauta litoralis TaxID=2705533 RepID=A0A7T0G0D8_9BACT|nr:MAG: ABC transporter permease subunit [Candidatus Nitronauta litoralis]
MNRQTKDKFVRWFLGVCAGVGCSLLVLVLAAVLWRGHSALSIEFLFSKPGEFGEGGIFYQVLGTLLLMAGAGILSFPIALGAALFQTEILRPGKVSELFQLLMYSLNAVPTVLFGLIGFMVFGVWLNTGVSWVTGVLILAVMILPTIQTAMRQSIEAIPEHYQEAARALGLSTWQRIMAVVFPQSAYGLVTGVLLGLARATGETAAIMFTATVFSGILIPESFNDPVLTLQTHILTLAQEAVDPNTLANAWGAGFALICIVFFLIGLSLILRSRYVVEADS